MHEHLVISAVKATDVPSYVMSIIIIQGNKIGCFFRENNWSCMKNKTTFTVLKKPERDRIVHDMCHLCLTVPGEFLQVCTLFLGLPRLRLLVFPTRIRNERHFWNALSDSWFYYNHNLCKVWVGSRRSWSVKVSSTIIMRLLPTIENYTNEFS